MNSRITQEALSWRQIPGLPAACLSAVVSFTNRNAIGEKKI
jgi:hypothetical protein